MLSDVLVIIVSILSVAGANSCPDDAGWWSAGDSCYLMSQGPLNWFDAQQVTTDIDAIISVHNNVTF